MLPDPSILMQIFQAALEISGPVQFLVPLDVVGHCRKVLIYILVRMS